MKPQEIWREQCEAARGIADDFGTERALGYLIGEKLLTFLGIAEEDPEWKDELPEFVAEINDIFQPWQITEYFNTPQRLGTLGHIADEEAHKMFRAQMLDEDLIVEDAQHLRMLEWARELFLDSEE